jgi:hypothetical protein
MTIGKANIIINAAQVFILLLVSNTRLLITYAYNLCCIPVVITLDLRKNYPQSADNL